MSDVTLHISSAAFETNASIPARYTCEGENVNPPLRIDNLPEETQALAIIVDDPDAPNGTFNHWMAWDLPVRANIEENAFPSGVQGKNGFGKHKYMGPCPPPGEEHRYFFKVYALNAKINLDEHSSREALDVWLKEKTIAYGQLVGLYRKVR